MNIHEFIRARPHLVWSTKNYDGLSAEAIVEATLNYGSWEDVQKLFKILGLKKVAKIFHAQIQQKRTNYRAVVKHYFTLYFQAHAQ